MRYFIESAPPSPTDEILDPEAIKRLNLSLEKLIGTCPWLLNVSLEKKFFLQIPFVCTNSISY